MNNTKQFTGFDGHLILYCKMQYDVKNVDLLTGLRRIWAIRCGYDYKQHDKSCDRYIANHLFEIYKELLPEKAARFYEIIHSEIENDFRYEGLTPIERLIYLYTSDIAHTQVREKVGSKYRAIIRLPRPLKRVMKRIVRGNGRYGDYKLIEKAS